MDALQSPLSILHGLLQALLGGEDTEGSRQTANVRAYRMKRATWFLELGSSEYELLLKKIFLYSLLNPKLGKGFL